MRARVQPQPAIVSEESRSVRQNSIRDFYLPKPSKKFVEDVVSTHLIKFFVDCNTPLWAVERDSFKKFVDILHLGMSNLLCRRHKLANVVFPVEAEKVKLDCKMVLNKSNCYGCYFALVSDNWKDAKGSYVMLVVMTDGMETYHIGVNSTGHTHDGMTVAKDLWDLKKSIKYSYIFLSNLLSLINVTHLSELSIYRHGNILIFFFFLVLHIKMTWCTKKFWLPLLLQISLQKQQKRQNALINHPANGY